MKQGELIHYLAVGRPDRSGNAQNHELLASLITPYGESNPKSNTFKETVSKILKKANKLENGKRIRLTSDDGYEIHVNCEASEQAAIIFIAITNTSFGTHHNIPTFCDEFKTLFTKAIPRSEWGASRGSIVKRIDSVLAQVVKKYNTSQLIEANTKVSQVQSQMTENMSIAIQNTEQIEQMDQKSAQLEESSREFHDKSKKVKCRMLQNRAVLLGLVAVVVVVVVIIIVVGVVATKEEPKK